MALKLLVFLAILNLAISDPEPDPGPDIQIDIRQEVNAGGCCPEIEQEPSCVFGFKTYEDGTIIEDVCMLLKCMKGSWKYLGQVRHECGNCTIYGDPHFYIFDNHTSDNSPSGNSYLYLEDGDFTIIQNGLGIQNKTEFGVDSEFVNCPFGNDISCVKSVTYYEPGIKITMMIPEPDNSCVGDNDPQCAIKVHINGDMRVIGSSVEEYYATDGTVLVFRHNHIISSDLNLNCMNIVGSQSLSVSFCSHSGDFAFVYVFAMPSLRSDNSQLYGLCGTYTGITQDGYTERDGSITTDSDTFADSWKIGATRSIRAVKRAASVNKCLNPAVLIEITAECINITKPLCAVLSPAACVSINAACIFDLCRMPNHASYAAGYANHVAVQTHLAATSCWPRPVCGGLLPRCCPAGLYQTKSRVAWCDCHFVLKIFEESGCIIRWSAPANKACYCWKPQAAAHCNAKVVDCINPDADKCKHPDASKTACLLARGGNCDGY